jgi:hypothetical protein
MRTIRELLRHKDVSTAMICALNWGGRGPSDGL